MDGRAVLVTGGAGYIGSHVVVELMGAGHDVVILDNFENADRDSPERIARIAGAAPLVEVADVRDRTAIDAIFRRNAISAVIHAAGKKAVGESVAFPLRYHDANVCGAVALLQSMEEHGVTRLVFSSSATVYGAPERLPIDENAALGTTNPYGRTKHII